MLNIKSKKRIVQIIIACLCLSLVITGGAYILNNFISEASAATKNVSVGTSTLWNSTMNGASSGDIINITLTANISTDTKLTAIPSGVTVNLNMAGYSITMSHISTSSGSGYMATSYTSGTYYDGTYWGLITNNGDLTITGIGTITNLVANNAKDSNQRGDYPQRVAAIVNGTGTLTIGSGITVEAYMDTYRGDDYFKDMFLYNCAVYNDNGGTVKSSGTIKAGGFAFVRQGNSYNSYSYTFNYGIYGGTVYLTGGSVSVEGYSGCSSASISCKEGMHVMAFAIGVYSNNAVILGNTSIKAYTETNQGTSNDIWGSSGWDVSYSAGVMYTGTNYPVIGASVDIDSGFGFRTNTLYAPGYESCYVSVNYDDAPKYYVRVGYTVVGVSANQYTIGQHTTESNYTNAFFGSNSYSVTNSNTTSEAASYFGYNHMRYISEDVYYDNLGSSYYTTAGYVYQSGSSTKEELHAYITNGAPGQSGGQFLIMYRYYDNSVSSSNLTKVSYSYDSDIQSTRAYLNVSGSSNRTGTVSDTSYSLTLGGGGAVRNSYYYTLASTTFEKLSSATYANRSIDKLSSWSGGATSFSSGTTLGTKGYTIIIYMNYVKKSPTAIRVAAMDADQSINQYSESTSFTVEYTGSALVPGTDFKIGIIDMGADSSVSSNSTTDDTVVTSVYNITGSGSGSRAVTYKYSKDGGTTYLEGLPKDVGTYKIQVTVNADTTYAVSNSYNREGGTFYIDCTITQATPTISGNSTASGTYGSTYGELIDTNSFTVTGKGSDTMTGVWTFSGVSSIEYPNVGTTGIYLTWTPSGTTANNYKSATYTVTLTVNRRDVTVNVNTGTVTYGDSTPTYNITYDNLAPCDVNLTSGWESNTKIQIQYNGAWMDYYAGIPVGTYDAKITSFGGDSDLNNNFTKNDGKLTVTKRTLVYTASATDRAYDTTTTVDVTLTYANGIYGGDDFYQTISTKGTIASANAGNGKAVTVNADDSLLQNSTNYTMSISNTPTVNISKADPADVVCAANPAEITYDSTTRLNSIALETINAGVAGLWGWEDGETVPTVDVSTYTAVFTPTDTNNYNSITQEVELKVNKAEVTVTVNEMTITYGDSVPSLTPVYEGFTGSDTIDNIYTTGSVSFITDYSRGADAGTYNITGSFGSDPLSAVNYNFTIKNSTITVEKKVLTVTAPSDSITYGDSRPTYDASDITFEGFYGNDSITTLSGTCSFSSNYTSGNNAGEYYIRVSGYSSDNYSINYVDGVLTVNKAVLTVTPNSATITYYADVPSFTYEITGFKSNDTKDTANITGEPTITTTYTLGKSVNVYPVTIDVSAMTAVNYTFESGESATLTVNKATPTIDYTKVPTATVVTGQTYSQAVFDDAPADAATNPNNSSVNVPGTWALKDADTVAVFETDDFRDVIFTPADTTNYYTAESQAYLTVTEKEILGKPVISGTLMVGETLTASVASMDPSDGDCYSYQWYTGSGSKITGATGQTYTIKEDDVDETFYVVVTATAHGYKGTAQSDKTGKVTQSKYKVLQVSDFTYQPVTTVYNAQTQSVTVTPTVDSAYIGTITVKYDGSTTAPKDVGTYLITIDVGAPNVSGNESDYYAPISGLELGELTITPATVTLTITADSKTYDGTTAINVTSTSLTGVLGSDSVDADKTNAHYSFEDANAGTDKTISVSGITLTGDDANNYTLVTAGTADINKATLTGRAYGEEREYNGAATVNVTITDITGYADIDSEKTVYVESATAVSSSVNAGTWNITNITVVLGGSSKDNYEFKVINEGTAQVTITKATPTVETPTIPSRTYDAGITLLNIGLSEYTTSAGYWKWDDTSTVPTVNGKSYSATFVSTDTNYSDYQTTIPITVTPAKVTLKADNKFVSYGQPAPTYTLTASGLTGSDTINDIGGYYSFSCTYSAGQSVNTYVITLNSSLSDDNYTFTTETGILTVTPATITVQAEAATKVYDGSNEVKITFTPDKSVIYGNDDVSLTFEETTGTAASANAGTYIVTYAQPELTGAKAGNYIIYVTPASGVLTATINKADLEVIFPTQATVPFGNTLVSATFTDNYSGAGTFAFSDTTTVFTTLNYGGSYEVVFTPTDSVNYNTQTGMAYVRVVKCDLNYVVGISGTVQSGEKLNSVITGMPTLAYDYVQYQWFRVDSDGISVISGATDSIYTLTDDDVGYTIVLMTYFEDSAPYYISEETDSGFISEYKTIIGQTSTKVSEVKLSFWQRLMNWIYKLIAAITGLTLSVGG